jgi:hypothetical protein
MAERERQKNFFSICGIDIFLTGLLIGLRRLPRLPE